MVNRLYIADIAVLGAGPAGIAAGLALHQAGLNVCLIGLATSNDLRIGEFLPASVLRLFRALDISGIEDVLARETYMKCSAKKSAWGSETWTYQDSLRDPEGGGWHILRHRFEQQFLDLATKRGLQFNDAKLREVSDNGQVFRICADGKDGRLNVECPRLIDATGRKAWLVRRIASAPRSGNAQMAVAGWFSDTDQSVERVTQVKSVGNGWWYTAPLPGQRRVVAFHGLADSVSSYFHQPDHFVKDARRGGLDNAIAHNAPILAPLQTCDASVGLSSNIAGKRWLAVGDAALTFDPLSSQGLHFALYSAIKAKDAVCHAIQARDERDAYEAMEMYCGQISDVFKANQLTRYLFYNQETRYREEPYWVEQRKSF